LVFRINYDWCVSFSKNPKVKFRLRELGLEGDNLRAFKVFNKFYNEVFKLKSGVERKFSAYLAEAKPSNSSALICTQLRTRYASFTISEKSLDMIFNFIKTELLLLASSDYKLFVTSDYGYITQKAIDLFGLNNVFKTNGTFGNFDNIRAQNSCDLLLIAG
jgi:hypothetical protein